MGKSIKSTVAVSIAILLIAVASLSISSIYFIHNANNALYEINEINTVKQRYAINFRGSAHDRSIYIRDYILSVHDGDNNTEIKEKIQELKEFYDDSETKLETMLADPNIPVDDNDKLYFENIKAMKKESENYISYIINNSSDPETFALAQHTLMHGGREVLFKWVDEINVFIDWQEEKNSGIRDHVSSLVNFFYTLILVLSIVAGVFLIGIAIWLMKTVVPLGTISKALHNIAEGDADLTSKLPVTSQNEIGQVADQFNKFVSSMHGIMLTVRKSIDNLAVNGNKLPASVDTTKNAIININQDLSGIKSQMEAQSHGVSDVSANINKINENISNLNEMIEKQTESVDNSSAAVEELVANVQSVTNTVSKSMIQFDNLTKVSENGFQKVADVQNQVSEIAEKSKVMSDANHVINEIAAQTNLLAMNAAIEAAHAGEAGKGFAVVADEIRKLAENSATQSKAISHTLQDLISSIDTVVDSSKEAGTAFEAVRSAVGMVQNLQHQISNAMDEQSVGNTQVGQSFTVIKDLNHNVRKGSAEMMRASENIHDMMQNLVKTTHDIIESVSHMTQTTGDLQDVVGSLEQVGTSTAENISAVEYEIRRFTL